MELSPRSPHRTALLPPPDDPPKQRLIDTALECVQAVIQEVSLQQQALQSAVTTRAKATYDAGSTRVYSAIDASRYFLQRAIVFYVLLTTVLAVLVAALSGCLIVSVATAAGIRHLVLANVPGTAVIPLHFNALPFHSDDWQRHMPEDAALREFLLPDRETRALLQGVARQADTAAVVERRMEQFADAKFSLLSHFVNSHLASTTMPIPRAAASADVFSPRGGVNVEGLFQLGPALFNAKGEYTAKLQVVLAKEEVGRDVPLVLESAMLFSEDATAVQPLAHFDVLFRQSTSAAVRTGPPYRAWFVVLAKQLLRLTFYLPVRSYEYLERTLRQGDGAPFPPVDAAREVAVVLGVYERFTPPLALQPRLRAMNFTLFQLPDVGAPSRVKVSRLVFLSTVRLTGVARWMTDYPVSTFLLLVSTFFGLFAIVSVGSVLSLFVYVYWRWSSTPSTPDARSESDSDDDFFHVPPRDMPVTTYRRVPSPAVRQRRNSTSFYDALDTSQLRRSQSFHPSTAKKQQ